MAGEKVTKYCELSVTLLNGAHVKGRFHIEARTTSTIRPSDAIRENKDGMILLTDVTFTVDENARELKAAMIPMGSVAFIELPAARWITVAPPLQTPAAASAS